MPPEYVFRPSNERSCNWENSYTALRARVLLCEYIAVISRSCRVLAFRISLCVPLMRFVHVSGAGVTRRVCVKQVMSLTIDDDGSGRPAVADEPTRNFPTADDVDDMDAIWQMYGDLPPTRQLADTGDYLDFFSAANTSALALLMASFGANDSDRLRSLSSADTFKTVVDSMTLYVTPFIVVIGVVGNALSLAVFSLTYLQRLSSSLYLSMLSVADIVFLMALLVIWLERVDAHRPPP